MIKNVSPQRSQAQARSPCRFAARPLAHMSVPSTLIECASLRTGRSSTHRVVNAFAEVLDTLWFLRKLLRNLRGVLVLSTAVAPQNNIRYDVPGLSCTSEVISLFLGDI